jgi:hypothetical protein
MMKKRFVFILFCLLPALVKAQLGATTGVPTANNGNRTPPKNAGKSTDKKIGSLVEDSHYFGSSDFLQGELRTREGLFTTVFGFRFDQLQGAIEVQKEDGTTMFLDETEIVYCKIFYEKATHVFVPLTLPKDDKLTLVQVIYKTPTLQLFRHIRKIYEHQTPSYQYGNPLGNSEMPLKVRNDYHYYIRKGDDQPLKEVFITTKSFIKALPEKEKTIVRLFKEANVRGPFTVSAICKMMGKLDK